MLDLKTDLKSNNPQLNPEPSLSNSSRSDLEEPVIKKSILKPIDSKTMTPSRLSVNSSTSFKPQSKKILPIIIIIIIFLGIGSGYILASMNNNGSSLLSDNDSNLKREVSSDEIQVGTKVGVADESTFKDDAIGTVEKSGVDGEGSHKLIREGGDSQTVALTSSIIDLDQFVSRKVHIWGETMSAQKAGWFMDVGKLEVLE